MTNAHAIGGPQPLTTTGATLGSTAAGAGGVIFGSVGKNAELGDKLHEVNSNTGYKHSILRCAAMQAPLVNSTPAMSRPGHDVGHANGMGYNQPTNAIEVQPHGQCQP